MTITTFDGYIASPKQLIEFTKTASRTTVAAGWFSLFDIAGNPGAGTLAGTSTSAGVVPTDATAGCPVIDDFRASATGYLAGVKFGSSVASRLRIADMLFKAGAYSYAAATTTLSSQPSYSSRIPGGNYKETSIWIEVTTAFSTGTAWTVKVTYTNQDGTDGRSTVALSTMAAASLTAGRMYQLPLQAGDTGVQKIESVVVTNGGTAMTVGAFNVLVLRTLWMGRVRAANDGGADAFTDTMAAQVYADSALIMQVAADSTASGYPEALVTIANG